jgi:hypothetical protein
MVKVFEVVAAWPLVFAAFHAISKLKKKHSGEKSESQKKGEEHDKKS